MDNPIKAKLVLHYKTWVIEFYHPFESNRRTRASTQTHDETEARAIMLDLIELSSLGPHPADEALALYRPRACQILHPNRERDDSVHGLREKSPPPLKDLLVEVARQPNIWQPFYQKLWKQVTGYTAEIQKQKDEIRVLKQAQLELTKLQEKLNKHVTISLGQCVNIWVSEYGAKPLARKTRLRFTGAVKKFVDYATPDLSLADVETTIVDKWILSLNVQPITRRAYKAALSIFFRWATKRFSLSQNPMSIADPITGIARARGALEAIVNFSDFQSLLEQLNNTSYWKTWVATACLAGLRFSEQVYLETSDIDLNNGLIWVRKHKHVTKTGRERRIPIERSILLPLLRDHVTKYPTGWAFPSLVDEGTVKRTKTPAGIWSDNSTWRRNYLLALNGATKPDYLTYTQREWRHTFGTILGFNGWSAIQISRVMGNSPAVADEYYVGKLHGKPWPVEY